MPREPVPESEYETLDSGELQRHSLLVGLTHPVEFARGLNYSPVTHTRRTSGQVDLDDHLLARIEPSTQGTDLPFKGRPI